MSINKMSKEQLELLSNKDITNMILEESKKPMNTADLFKKIIQLLELPETHFETKIGDYYTSLTIDKRFVLMETNEWDIRDNHSVEIVLDDDLEDEVEEEIDEEEEIEEEEEENIDEVIEDDLDDDDIDELSIVTDEELEEE